MYVDDHLTLIFEDRLSIQYQIQEMLRVERIFEEAAIADEDMERSDDERTAAVHFLRFELDAGMIDAWNDGADVSLASTLDAMPVAVKLTPEQRCALAADFQ